MATLMLFCELILFIIRSKYYNLIYYTNSDYRPKVYSLFFVAFDVFYIFKKYIYFMYVAYNRFDPAFVLQ